MMNTIMVIVLVLITISILLCVYRIVKGPSTSDRVMALDSIGINLISATAIASIMLRTTAFLEVILLIGIVSFIGTIAFSKFIVQGRVMK